MLDLPLVETLNAIHFDHDYTEVEDGVEVRKKVHPTARSAVGLFSQATYGTGRHDPALGGSSSAAAG